MRKYQNARVAIGLQIHLPQLLLLRDNVVADCYEKMSQSSFIIKYMKEITLSMKEQKKISNHNSLQRRSHYWKRGCQITRDYSQASPTQKESISRGGYVIHYS